MSDGRILLNSWACFFVHFCIEIICFTVLTHTFGVSGLVQFFLYMAFDIIAFYPQFIVGVIHERFPKLDIPTISVAIMAVGLLILQFDKSSVRSMIAVGVIALGNAFLHDCCAIQTTLIGKGKLFPAALYVSGGSFGVVLGQIFGRSQYASKWCLFIVLLIMWGLLLFTNSSWLIKDYVYPKYDLVKKDSKYSYWIVVFAAYFVTFVRSFMGYAIPISWKKSTWQAILLFFIMGLGKALGGYLTDKFGAKKVGIISTLISIPFLICGKDMMVVSIIGVFFFSMTMSITFGMFLSVIPKNPGVAFGLTTLALGNGIMVPFAFGDLGFVVNVILIVVLSILCAIILGFTLKGDKERSSV
ncbi:hypothetical protein [Butyrivibrio proteoclasticus]|uniref:hypothetical protein n=1 Tax=Butyrivibrio proteoclasticus TaxID=43305 RepID=UPI00047A6320|nr:hypothetical protein [Butyrivibrio proteoclasticus]